MPRAVRDIVIVIFLIGAGLVILFSSPKSAENGFVTRVAYSIVRPFQETITSIRHRVTSLKDRYVNLVNVREENQALKEQLKELKRERAQFVGAESENRRLKKLLNLKSRHEFPSLVAQVIGEDAVGWYRSFLINRGSDDGVSPAMPVTVAEGLVGRVVKTSSDMAQVLLIADPNVSVDCRVARTRDRGVLSGSLDRGCILRYLNLKSDVRVGDEVFTSGLDGVFPRGLAVGRVESVTTGSQGLFLEAAVVPWVDFSELEEVLVVLGQPAGFDLQPGLEDKR